MAEIYKNIIKYIDEHINEEITIDDLSRFAGYSKWNIYKLFSSYNDLPVMEYIRRKKISAAASEFHSAKKLYDIALDYGYETPAGFNKAFQSIFGCSPSDYKNNLLRSTIMDNERTIEEINKAIELEPNNAELYAERAHIYINQLNQLEKAIEDLNKAIELEPDTAYFYARRGQIYSQQLHLPRAASYSQQLQQPEKAIEDYTRAIELESNQVYYYRDRAWLYQRLNQPERADEDSLKVLELTANTAESWEYLNRGLVYQQLKKPDKALEEFKKLTELEPDNFWGYFNRGLIYMSDGFKEFDKALEEFDKTIELNPDYMWGYHSRGWIYMNDFKEYGKALEEFSKVIELDPNYAGGYTHRANCYQNLGQFDKADEDFMKALEITSPNEPFWGYQDRAWEYSKLKQYDKAAEMIEKSIERNPDMLSPLEARVYNCINLGQYGKAIEYANEALKIVPREEPNKKQANMRLYRDRGWAYGKTGEHEKAETDLTKAIELDTGDLETWYRRSEYYAGSGQYGKAIADCGKALELNPYHEWVSELYSIRGYSYGKLSQYEKAIEDLNKSIELAPAEDRSWMPGGKVARKRLDEVLKNKN